MRSLLTTTARLRRRAYTLMTSPRSRFQDAVDRLISGSTRFELVYTTHPSWPQPATSSISTSTKISVLDSSFNPPTLAHSALASSSSANARLLLLSLSNVDKIPKPGDATPAQRLEMMVTLANELSAGEAQPGVAVGALNEPRFVGKSTLLLEQLSQRFTDTPPNIELTFQMGWDTIIRVFAPRYYPSPDVMLASFKHFLESERSTILCARRPPVVLAIPTTLSDEESDFLSSPYVAPFYQQGKIKLVDLDPSVSGISSSGVRGGTIEDAERWCSEGVVRYIREHQLYFRN